MPKVTPETKPKKRRLLIFSRVPGRIDAALAAAVAHLEKDAKQGDLPREEQKEDRALVAKLKAAQQAPAKPKRRGGLLF